VLTASILRRTCAAAKKPTTAIDRRSASDVEERKLKALEQVGTTLAKIHHELLQLRVQAAKINVPLVRKR
jgi:hypothetical protein